MPGEEASLSHQRARQHGAIGVAGVQTPRDGDRGLSTVSSERQSFLASGHRTRGSDRTAKKHRVVSNMTNVMMWLHADALMR